VKIVKDMSRDRSFDQGWDDGKKEAIREAVAMQNDAREQMYEYESHGFIGNMK
jgi:dienelactone hydrolase